MYCLRFSISLFALIITLCVSTTAWAFTYFVKKHDTLSEIVHEFVLGPVWGKNGTLLKVLARNPHIESPEFITPGEKITIDSDKNTLSQNDLASSNRRPAETTLGTAITTVAEPSTAITPTSTAPSLIATHTPTAAPSSRPTVVIPSKSAVEFSTFTFSGSLHQTRIDATDPTTGGTCILGSTLSPELEASWEQHWEGGFVSFLMTKVRFENFATTSLTQTLSNHTPTELSFETGAKILSLGSRGNISGSLAYDSDPFVRADSATDLRVDTVATPKGKINADMQFIYHMSLNSVLKLASPI